MELGRNILLVQPDLVGGYFEDNDISYFKMIRDETIFEDVSEEYGQIRARTVPYNPSMSVKDLREEIKSLEGIGEWQAAWSEVAVEDRGPEYFENYDLHIRSWIPAYDELVATACEYVNRELMTLLRQKEGDLKILEIGYGTGNLTAQVLEKIGDHNQRLFEASGSRPIHYFGIDRARIAMMPYLVRNAKISERDPRFFSGTVWSEIPQPLKREAPFDVVFGSLVLHDILANDPRIQFAKLLKEAEALLSEKGRFIFADTFSSPDFEKRNEQAKAWKRWMVENGLKESRASFFLTENSDMIETLNLEHLRAVASEQASLESQRIGAGWSPFQIIVLRKKMALLPGTPNPALAPDRLHPVGSGGR